MHNLKSNANNILRQKIIPKFKNLKSDSSGKVFNDINANAEALAKAYKKADTEIDEKYNAIKDKSSHKIQILIQAVLTTRAQLSSAIFGELDMITASIRENKLKNTVRTQTIL